MPPRERLDPATETLQRVRRIETRLTSLLLASGIDTHSQKPVFQAPATASPFIRCRIQVPSPHSSLREILACIPETWAGGEIDVFVDSDLVTTLFVADRS